MVKIKFFVVVMMVSNFLFAMEEESKLPFGFVTFGSSCQFVRRFRLFSEGIYTVEAILDENSEFYRRDSVTISKVGAESSCDYDLVDNKLSTEFSKLKHCYDCPDLFDKKYKSYLELFNTMKKGFKDEDFSMTISDFDKNDLLEKYGEIDEKLLGRKISVNYAGKKKVLTEDQIKKALICIENGVEKNKNLYSHLEEFKE